MALPYSLNGTEISDKYERLVQIVLGNLYDGEGNPINPTFSNTRAFTLAASRPLVTTNSFLKNGEEFSNISPFVIPVSGQLFAISVSTNGNSSWTLRTYVNGSHQASLDLVITSTDSEFTSFTIPFNISAGDKISFYCHGTGVNSPNCILIGTF